jgi:hypothetical protein
VDDNGRRDVDEKFCCVVSFIENFPGMQQERRKNRNPIQSKSRDSKMIDDSPTKHQRRQNQIVGLVIVGGSGNIPKHKKERKCTEDYV